MDKKALLWPKNEELSSTIVIGVREGRLFKLPRHIQALVHASVNPSELWHQRLGHLRSSLQSAPWTSENGKRNAYLSF
jgi:hypothetical protein